MCLGSGTGGTTTALFLRAVAGTGEVISNPARSVALGIRSANDGAGRETLVLAVEIDDAISGGEDGAEIETAAVTTRPPVAALVIGSAIPVSVSVVCSALFSGLSFRLALRVCRASGVCADDAVVCLPFCGKHRAGHPFAQPETRRACLALFYSLYLIRSISALLHLIVLAHLVVLFSLKCLMLYFLQW